MTKATRRKAKIIAGKNERSQRKCVKFKVGMSDFRVVSF